LTMIRYLLQLFSTMFNVYTSMLLAKDQTAAAT
jgi:hypothetical protein